MGEDLAAHGVAESLHGAPAQDPVAVVVEERVQLSEAQPAVAAQEGEAGGAQAATPELDGIVERRRERGSFGLGRLATGAVLDLGPELLAEEGELLEDLDAAGGAGVEGAVDVGELGDGLVARHLEGQAPLRRGALDGAKRTPATEVLPGGLAGGGGGGWGWVDRLAGARVGVVVRGGVRVGVAVAEGIDVHRVASERGCGGRVAGAGAPRWEHILARGYDSEAARGAAAIDERWVGRTLGARERIDGDSLPSDRRSLHVEPQLAANRRRFAA
ncbi:MAG: hypothetical protein R2702_16670 [Acidimicrobiales bacterium]